MKPHHGLLGVVLLAGLVSAQGSSVHASAPRHFGTTFAHYELAARGLDWRAALDAADDLGLDLLRIGANWDAIEPREGTFDFAELDDLIARAAAKNYKLLVTVGMKAPRWPEYHVPSWAKPRLSPLDAALDALVIPILGQRLGVEVSKDPHLRKRTLRFIEETVQHVKALPAASAIVAWQVENEPMDKAGPHRFWIGAGFLAEEVALVRRLDPGRTVLVNCWCEDQRISNFPWGDGDYSIRNALALADAIGLDTYIDVGGMPLNRLDEMNRCVRLPKDDLARAEAAGKDSWIIESQAEVWGSYDPSTQDVRWLVSQHLGEDYRTIVLWGFESWYAKKLAGNAAMWDTVKDLEGAALPAHAATTARTYTVQQGENLAAIARRLGVALRALEAANPQIPDPNNLVLGQVIALP